MIWLDPRVGSRELAQYFRMSSIPITTDEMLDSGDAMFVGNGVDDKGRPEDIMVGIERKTLPDLLQCMDDARFVGVQLGKMISTYHFAFLIVEGFWRPDYDGNVERLVDTKKDMISIWRPLTRGPYPVKADVLCNHLNTLRLKTDLIVLESADKAGTAWQVMNLYRWFQKPWEQHRSHLREHDPASIFRGKSSFERRVAMQLPNVGYEKSSLIEKAFTSVQAMANANEETWEAIPGIGKKGAVNIVKAFRNEKK
jgi:ERCC4-type nuclease